MTRALRTLAVAMALLSLGSIILGTRPTSAGIALLDLAWPLPNIVVGLVLTVRRPRLVTGWLFALIGFLAGTGAAADALASGLAAAEPSWWAVAGAWYGEWYWIPMIYVTLIFVPIVFPSGPPQSPRWRVVLRLMIATLATAIAVAMLQERLDTPAGLSTPNPIGIAGLADVEEGAASAIFLVGTLAYLIIAMASLVVRYRRSRGVERQQLKWFTSAATALIGGFILQGVGDALFQVRLGVLDVVLFALTPVAAGVAILRYRLYAIDRIISRTVTYALVTALLAAVYVGAVALISATVDPLAGESPFAIAVATLAAAAAFRPARQRIQRGVDRRFNRARYDVERTLDGFRDRVRNDVDLERLCADLVAITDKTLQPSIATVWLSAPDGGA